MKGVVGIIPARMKSTRLPGKPLKIIGARPMIQWVYEAVAASGACERVLVATDAGEIVKAVEAFGGEAVMTSETCATGTDRAAEVAAGLSCDVILNVQGDEPFISPAILCRLAEEMKKDRDLQMGTVAVPLRREEAENPSVVKVVLDAAGHALYFSRALIPYPRNLPPAGFWKHLGIYAYRREFLLHYRALPSCPPEQAESLEQLRALYHGYRIKVLRAEEDSLGIDTPEELERARKLADNMGKRGKERGGENAS